MIDSDVRALFSEALTEEPPAPPTLADDLARGRRRHTRRRLRIAAAGVVASTAAVAFTVTVMQPQLTQRTESPIELQLAPSVQTGESSAGPPRLLVDDPKWSVSGVGESDPDTGSLGYVLGDDPPDSWQAGTYDTAEIIWRRAGTSLDESLERWTEDPEDRAKYTVTPATIAGHDGAVIAREGQAHTAMWHDDGYEIRIWTTLPTLQEFEDFVSNVREVDLDTWLAEMPDDFSRAHDNSDAVAAMVEDVPVSEWFERDLPSHNERLNHIEPTDTDALRQEVTYLVACYWVKQWIHSDLDGEPISIDDELSTVVGWAANNDAMTDDVVWDYVESIIDGDADGQAMFNTAARDLHCGGW